MRSGLAGAVMVSVVAACGANAGGAVGSGGTRPGDPASSGSTPNAGDRAPAPTAVYMGFLKTLSEATSIDELTPYVALWVRSNLMQLAPDARREKLASAKREAAIDVKVIAEQIDGEKATLKVGGTKDGKPTVGSVALVREHGVWKISSEKWGDAK